MGSSWSQDNYITAFQFAAEAHQGQKIPGSELPYITHISLVTMEVIAALQAEDGVDGNLAVQCALLHDTIEDTAVTFEIVRQEFGEAVAQGVQALTKNASLPKPEAMADSLRRIQEQPKAVWMVKLADRITNLLPPPHYWTKEKIAFYQQEARQIHTALGGASPFLAARLAAKIEDYAVHLA
jgi:(p)ppGpp synthase/HD superfamily hydrolase